MAQRRKIYLPTQALFVEMTGRAAGTVTDAWLAVQRQFRDLLEGPIDLETEVTGTLPVTHGGTGRTNATEAFDNLAPTTTEGDLIVRGAANNERFPVGDANTALMATGTGWIARKVDLSSDVVGTLPAQNGGVGAIVQTINDTGDVDNLVLDPGVSLLRCANPSLLTLTGLLAGIEGQRLDIVSVGAADVQIANQDIGSSGPNRILCGVAATITLSNGVGRARLIYDATTNRWRVLLHVQGASVAPDFDAGDYTSSSGSWTVSSGNVDWWAFLLEGRRLVMLFTLRNTSVSGTPTTLQIAIPNGFTPAGPASALVDLLDNGARAVGVAQIAAGGSSIDIVRQDRTAFATSSSATDVEGAITCEVL
jgi:hypothetical protein